MLTFDLRSLATLAAARALETGGGSEGVEAGQQCPIRRRLNLRRKCSWTPRHEPVKLHGLLISHICVWNVGAADSSWLPGCFFSPNVYNNYILFIRYSAVELTQPYTTIIDVMHRCSNDPDVRR